MPLVLLRHGPKLAGALAVLGVVWWLMDVVSDRTRLQGELAASVARLSAAEAELTRQAETARIHRAHQDRAAEEAREWQALSRELQQMEGRDEPLSDLLRATSERLYGPQ